ncbi:MAG TPA: hypothetical protein VF707_07685 [Ardenticatenaceae bacterium]|jgi:transposase-like protein
MPVGSKRSDDFYEAVLAAQRAGLSLNALARELGISRQALHGGLKSYLERASQLPPNAGPGGSCRFPGCTCPAYARGLCQPHYQRARKAASEVANEVVLTMATDNLEMLLALLGERHNDEESSS